MGPVIQVRALARGFGPRSVLAGVDLAVGRGEIHGILGPAGAGKTTLLRMLAGLLPPTRGEVRALGRVELVCIDQGFERVSAFENLVFAGRMHGLEPLTCVERARTLLREAGLEGSCERAVGTFTPPMHQQLAVARSLMRAPAVLLIDESAHDVTAIRSLVRLHALRGGAAVWATGRLSDLQGLAGNVTLLAAGRVRYAGSVDALALRSLPGSDEPFAQPVAA